MLKPHRARQHRGVQQKQRRTEPGCQPARIPTPKKKIHPRRACHEAKAHCHFRARQKAKRQGGRQHDHIGKHVAPSHRQTRSLEKIRRPPRQPPHAFHTTKKIPRLREVRQQFLIRHWYSQPAKNGNSNETHHDARRTKAFPFSHHDPTLLQPILASAKRGGSNFLSQAICIFYLTLATRLHKQRASIL